MRFPLAGMTGVANACSKNISIFPQQQRALGSSAIVQVSEQAGAAPKDIPPGCTRFPQLCSNVPTRFPQFCSTRFPQLCSTRFPRLCPTRFPQGSQGSHSFAPRFPQGSHNFVPQRSRNFAPQGSHKVPPRFPRFPQVCSKVPAALLQGCPKVPTALLQCSHKLPTTLLQGSQKLPTTLPTLLQGSHKGPKVPTALLQGCPKVPAALLQGSHKVSTTLPHKFPKVPTRLLQGSHNFVARRPLRFPHKVPPRFPQCCFTRFQQSAQGSHNFAPRLPQGSHNFAHNFAPQGSSKVPTALLQGSHEVPTTWPRGSHKVGASFPQGSRKIPNRQSRTPHDITSLFHCASYCYLYLAYPLVSYPLSFLLFSIRAPNPLSGPESGFGPRIRFRSPNPQSRQPHHTSSLFNCGSFSQLPNLLVFYSLSVLLFSIRAPNPVSGLESTLKDTS